MKTTRIANRKSGLVVDLVTTTEGTEKSPVHVTVLAVGPEGGNSTLHAEVARKVGSTARRVRAASESLAHGEALAALPEFLDSHKVVAKRLLGLAA